MSSTSTTSSSSSSYFSRSRFLLSILPEQQPGAATKIMKDTKWRQLKDDETRQEENDLSSFQRFIKLASHKYLPPLPESSMANNDNNNNDNNLVREYFVPVEKLYSSEKREQHQTAATRGEGEEEEEEEKKTASSDTKKTMEEIDEDMETAISDVAHHINELGPLGNNSETPTINECQAIAAKLVQVLGVGKIYKMIEEPDGKNGGLESVSEFCLSMVRTENQNT